MRATYFMSYFHSQGIWNSRAIHWVRGRSKWFMFVGFLSLLGFCHWVKVLIDLLNFYCYCQLRFAGESQFEITPTSILAEGHRTLCYTSVSVLKVCQEQQSQSPNSMLRHCIDCHPGFQISKFLKQIANLKKGASGY